MHDEKKLIRLAMITLFLSLMIVYVLLYQVKWNKLKVETPNKTINEKVSIVPKSWTIILSTTLDNETTGNLIHTWNINNSWNKAALISSNSWTKSWATQGTKIRVLSWTDIYYWESKIIDKLWIKYQYALKDKKDIYYFNLGNPTYNFGDIAKSLWWNTFTLITEQDIFQNKLFWNKVIFLNLPENKDKTTLMIVYIKNEVWMIQIWYDIYHQSKSYLKSLFID